MAILFQHVDGVYIRPERMVSDTHTTRLVCVGDAVGVEIEMPDAAPAGVAVQINGPASAVKIPYVRSTTAGQDDLVAITPNDYTSTAFSAGDITDVHVGTLIGAGNNHILKLLAGAGCYLGRVTVDAVLGTAGSYGVVMGEDDFNPGTQGGTFGSVDLKWVDCVPTGSSVGIQSMTVDSVRIRGKGYLQNAVHVYGSTTAVMGTIDVTMDCRDFAGNAVFVQATNLTVDRVLLDACTFITGENNGTLFSVQGASATIDTVELRNCYTRHNTSHNGYDVYVVSGTVNHIKVIGGAFSDGYVHVRTGTVSGGYVYLLGVSLDTYTDAVQAYADCTVYVDSCTFTSTSSPLTSPTGTITVGGDTFTAGDTY